MARNAAIRSTLPPVADEAVQARPEAVRPQTTISLAGPSMPHQDAVGARALQAMITKRLNSEVIADVAIDDRWSLRKSVAFILFSSLGLWGAIVAALIWLHS